MATRQTTNGASASAACRPAPQHTYLTIGQDLFSIDEYVRGQYNASLHQFVTNVSSLSSAAADNSILNKNKSRPTMSTTRCVTGQQNCRLTIPTRESFLPAAFMFYTDIQKLLGLTVPADYGSGVEYADGLLALAAAAAASPGNNSAAAPPALQIGLWLNGTAGCADLVAGRLDPQVAQLYRYLMQHYGDDENNNNDDDSATFFWRKIFLRVGYEFDNGFFGYRSDPASFRAAFRYLVDACDRLYARSVCSDRIAFVWHSWGAGVGSSLSANTTTTTTATLNVFYPGDDYVDWIGVSLFSQLYTDPQRQTLGNRDTITAVLDFAAYHNKPVMIAESTPFGGIDALNDPWKDWFEPVLQLIDEYDIGMWSYINCDWDAQPMWHNVGFGETRLSTNATVMKLWKERVLDNPRFLTRLSNNCQEQQPQVGAGAFFVEPMAAIASGTFRRDGDNSQGNVAERSWFLFAASIVALVLLLPFTIGYFGMFRRCARASNNYATTPPAADHQQQKHPENDTGKKFPGEVLMNDCCPIDYGSLSGNSEL